jgi:hypothetical protein
MGGEGAWDHINSCSRHNSNWTSAHEHVLRVLDHIVVFVSVRTNKRHHHHCNDDSFATSHKRVLTSEGGRCADLDVRKIRVSEMTDLLIDVTLCHDFIDVSSSGLNQGQLRNPDNPDHILENVAADKIRTYRDPYQLNQQVVFLQACMSTSGRIHGELLSLIFFLSNKQTDNYFAALGYQVHKEEFCYSSSVFFHRNQCTIGMACDQAVVLRVSPTTVCRHVTPPSILPPLHMSDN